MRINRAVLLIVITICWSFGPISVYSEPMTVNINTATLQELDDVLPGIGPAKAKMIIEYRQKNGPFKNLEDVGKVKGIGPKILERISTYIRFDDGKAVQPAATQTEPDDKKPQQPNHAPTEGKNTQNYFDFFVTTYQSLTGTSPTSPSP